MRSLVAVVCALGVGGIVGCGAAGTSSPELVPPPAEDLGVSPIPESSSGDRGVEGEMRPAASSQEPEPPVRAEGECQQAAQLAAGGDHKPALDSLTALRAAGGSCDPDTLASIAESRRILAEADALVRAGLEARRRGDFTTAKASFEQALSFYPKYYWVQRLQEELPAEPEVGVLELQQRAEELRAKGRAEEALHLLSEAPAAVRVRPELQAAIEDIRTELGDRLLSTAHRELRAGNPNEALALTRRAIEVEPGDPVRGRVIDFARRLGLNLFSAGELLAAQAIWGAALALDESNDLLREYLDEVEARLRSLDDIKSRSAGGEPGR